MKWVQYEHQGKQQIGVIEKKGIKAVDLTLEEVLNGQSISTDFLKEEEGWIQEEEVTFLPCILTGKKIICVGLNYKKHAEESGMDVPKYPILFNKFSNGLAGHQSVVQLPETAVENDYEAELGVVIGHRTKNVSEEEALDVVFGYCNVNDLSARDLQMRTGQWMLGKTLDGYCPVGPYLVTADEVGDPNQLEIKLTLNGEVRQSSNTVDMIFSVPAIISYVSKYMTLEPGDLILTGTPEGVIMGYPEDQKQWLKNGDEVTVEIEKLGALTTVFK